MLISSPIILGKVCLVSLLLAAVCEIIFEYACVKLQSNILSIEI